MINGYINFQVGSKYVDIAIVRDGIQIAVEYDAFYWHAGRETEDIARDQYLISEGWRVLHVKSNTKLPSPAQLDTAIAKLLNGDTYAEIVLDDWGHGPVYKTKKSGA